MLEDARPMGTLIVSLMRGVIIEDWSERHVAWPLIDLLLWTTTIFLPFWDMYLMT